jgi:hypothetical protein
MRPGAATSRVPRVAACRAPGNSCPAEMSPHGLRRPWPSCGSPAAACAARHPRKRSLAERRSISARSAPACVVRCSISACMLWQLISSRARRCSSSTVLGADGSSDAVLRKGRLKVDRRLDNAGRLYPKSRPLSLATMAVVQAQPIRARLVTNGDGSAPWAWRPRAGRRRP